MLAALELVHPASFDATSEPVWVPLHAALLVGYVALAAVLWPDTVSAAARLMLVVFGVCNTAYLAIDGLLARPDPVWEPVLANATGATWSAALLLLAVALRPAAPVRIGAALTWIAFVAGAFVAPLAPLSFALAIASAAYLVYAEGAAALAAALLIVAAVLRQHVGPAAALGLLFVALALFAKERSAPAAASRL